MLTPNAVNKVVAFQMICRANGYLLDYFVFKFFFRFYVTGDKCTFSVRRGGHALVPDMQTPKNWQDKWLWVNQELVGSDRYRVNAFADTIPKLFPHNQSVTDYLKISRFILRSRTLLSSSVLATLSVLTVNSMGSIDSVAYVKHNEVSCVLVRGVVLCDHNIVGISSAQFPFALANIFLTPFTIVRLDTSVYPFACGCATDVNR
ncbi:unnamed protein product [Lactuca saligna]|uniref:Uncharacterized protein n=1 Tax=Lactuca saligna TaxID=75948 RepID=A0AA35ZXF9_LACSI|nr:unnamed protein product [Lactuca saligna]